MPEPGDVPDVIEGPTGRAWHMAVPDVATTESRAGTEETACQWLITAPMFHPAWSQYHLLAVRLRDGVPGFAPPVRLFPSATHEILCVSLDPLEGHWSAETALDRERSGLPLPMLMPPNCAIQVEATDGEVAQVVRLCAWGVCNSMLEPEATNGAEWIRAAWQNTVDETLAHLRGHHEGREGQAHHHG